LSAWIRHPWSATRRQSGFTLIEVIGALVIFSLGVLMVMQVSGALGTQMRSAGARSEIVVLANASLDSLGSTPFASITAGTTRDTLNVQGWLYERTVTITALTPVLAKIDVAMSPVDSVGPSHAVSSYTSAVW
jgi:prepilin-type N-terminal cleavage/methylation domain-containing protein